ncbi:MAG: DUF1705 domain-containing protein [Gammaproteobacteria bacterium]|nr:MAG: DUF1705 domain-containing protein [Gammaproteobacteria bacterium]
MQSSPGMDSGPSGRGVAALAGLGALLLSPDLLWPLVADDPLDALLRGLAPSLALCVFLVAWVRRPGLLLRLASPFFLLLPFELYYLAEYHRPSDGTLLGVIAESNVREALEYLGTGTLLGLVTAGLLLAGLAWRWTAQAPVLPARHRMVRLLRAASLVPLVSLANLEYGWSRMVEQHFDPPRARQDRRLLTPPGTPTEHLLQASYPAGVPLRLLAYVRERRRLAAVAESLHHRDLHVRRTAPVKAPETYVLVIGESAVADHWQLNGYDRPTNPELSRLPRRVSLANLMSPWAATRLAVPVMLTGTQGPDGRAPLDQPSVIDLFRQAGFRTAWLSNQPPLGPHESLIAVHAWAADRVLFLNPTHAFTRAPYDGVLLPAFRRFLADPAPRKFLVVHLMGSHLDYGYRYPPAFDRFGQTRIDAYDDSILYTDHVLAALIRALDARPGLRSALLYASDHGETLPEHGCHLEGHGFGTESDYRPAGLIWFSARLQRERPAAWRRLQARRQAPFTTRGVMHTLADLAELRYDGFDPRESWVNPGWRPHRRANERTQDFDHAPREGPCKRLSVR